MSSKIKTNKAYSIILRLKKQCESVFYKTKLYNELESEKPMHHIMKLQPNPFNRIKEGTKIIELRLYDEKRQQIKLRDTIEFQKEPEKEEKLQTEVTGLLNYPTFKDLINDFPVEYFGGTNKETLIQDVHQFYSEEDEKQFGVLGIKITIVQG